VDIVTEMEQTVQCEVMIYCGQTVLFELLSGIGQTVEESNGHCDTEPKDSIL